jgi:folate-dependent phosphoribosylglycinamide formyltransferase PurN
VSVTAASATSTCQDESNSCFSVQQQEMQEQKKAARLQAKQRKEAAVPEEVNERRVSQLMELRLAVNVAKDTKRAGNVKELMNVAKQDLVILGGESKFLSDAMIAAMVNRNILTSNNLLVSYMM